MSRELDARIEKLPGWAQADMRRLAARVESLEATLAEYALPADEANITYRLPAELAWRSLPEGVTVRYRDGRGWVSLAYPLKGEGVSLRSSRALILYPGAANALELRDDA